MKKILALLFCFYIFNGQAQKQADYEKVLGKFMMYYNAVQADSICEQFSDTWGKQKKTLWKNEEIKDLHKEFGEMRSYKFMAVEPGGAMLFKGEFTKSKHCIGMVIDKKNKLKTFRFKTTSDFIDSLLLVH